MLLVPQFYDHFFDWGLKEEIKSLIDVRKRNGINAGASVKIAVAEGDLYVATIDDKLVLKLGTRQDLGALTPGADYKVAAFGKDYCVWEKAGAEPVKEPATETATA